MKYRRLILGLIAIVVALWIIVGEQMSGGRAILKCDFLCSTMA